MMGASIRKGVEWIAFNDEPQEMDAEVISGFISTLLLADLFNQSPLYIAKKVVKLRQKRGNL